VKHTLDGGEVLTDVDDGANDTLRTRNAHIGPDTLVEAAMDREKVSRAGRAVAHHFCLQDLVFEDRTAGIHFYRIMDKPAGRVGGFVVFFELLTKTEILLHKRFVGLFELEIVFDIVVSLVYVAGDLGGDIQKGGLVEFVEAKEEGKRDYLQHQEEEEVEMPSDEEKNVTHR
jgi:hypothetical protein